MNNNTKKVLSFALASTLVAGVPVFSNAECQKPELIIEDTTKDLNYYVEDGDTLGGISEKFFGTPRYYKIIAHYNHISDPWWIYSGQLIKIPHSLNHLLIDTYPREYEPDQLYIIEEGDVLFSIVENFYDENNIIYVNKLATYNDLDDPNTIHVGDELLIPEKAKLDLIIPRDYTLQYEILEWRISHPGEDYPDWIQEKIEKQKELILIYHN